MKHGQEVVHFAVGIGDAVAIAVAAGIGVDIAVGVEVLGNSRPQLEDCIHSAADVAAVEHIAGVAVDDRLKTPMLAGGRIDGAAGDQHLLEL